MFAKSQLAWALQALASGKLPSNLVEPTIAAVASITIRCRASFKVELISFKAANEQSQGDWLSWCLGNTRALMSQLKIQVPVQIIKFEQKDLWLSYHSKSINQSHCDRRHLERCVQVIGRDVYRVASCGSPLLLLPSHIKAEESKETGQKSLKELGKNGNSINSTRMKRIRCGPENFYYARCSGIWEKNDRR